MRELTVDELDVVSGAGQLVINTGIVGITMTFDEIGAGYNWAVEQATNFFMWWDPKHLLATNC